MNYDIDHFCGTMEEEGWKTQRRTKYLRELGMSKWDKI